MDTVRIERFTSRVEAEFACSMLRANGLNAILSADDVAGVHPDIPFGIGGTAVVVPREQYDEAIALLDSEYHGALGDEPEASRAALDDVEAGVTTDVSRRDWSTSGRTADRRPGMAVFAIVAAIAMLVVFLAAVGSSAGWW